MRNNNNKTSVNLHTTTHATVTLLHMQIKTRLTIVYPQLLQIQTVWPHLCFLQILKRRWQIIYWCFFSQIKVDFWVCHTHTHTKVKMKTSVFYLLNWTAVLGDELTVLFFWGFFHVWTWKGAKKTLPHTDLTHTGEVGKKTCLTSPDLTCKFSFRVCAVIVELLLEKGPKHLS